MTFWFYCWATALTRKNLFVYVLLYVPGKLGRRRKRLIEISTSIPECQPEKTISIRQLSFLLDFCSDCGNVIRSILGNNKKDKDII
jgi:hypothetical protein